MMDATMRPFFSFGSDPSSETQNEVLAICVQPKRSMFYNRRYGAGVKQYEGAASSFAMQVSMKFSIVNSIGLYNQRATNGTNGFPDRRAAISQATIDVIQGANGETDVTVLFIPMADMQNPRKIGIGIGAGGLG